MNNSELIHRLFAWVLHDDMERYNVSSEDVIKGIERMKVTYKHNPQNLTCQNSDVTDFHSTAFRCAYLHKYASLHGNLVYEIFSRIINEKYNYFNDVIMDFSNINLCSLGGGPGSDVVGIICALHNYFGLFPIHASIIDCMPSWNATFNSLIHESQNGTYGNLGLHLNAEFFSWGYIGSDLLAEFTFDVKEAISSANIINMVKFVSAAACIDTEAMVKRIFHLMKPGAIVLFIDNSVGDIKHVMTKIAIQFDMDPIFGPINHEDYVNESVKVSRFGYSSCFKTKIAIQVWRKPFKSYNAEENVHQSNNFFYSSQSPKLKNCSADGRMSNFNNRREKNAWQNSVGLNLNTHPRRNMSPAYSKRQKTSSNHLEMVENISLSFHNCSFDGLPPNGSFIPLYSETPKHFRERHQKTIFAEFDTPDSFSLSHNLPSDESFIPLFSETPKHFRERNQQTSFAEFDTSHSFNHSHSKKNVKPLHPVTPQRFKRRNKQTLASTPIKLNFYSPTLNQYHSSPVASNTRFTSLNNFELKRNRIEVFEQNKSLQNSNFRCVINESPDYRSVSFDNENVHHSCNDFAHNDSGYWGTPVSSPEIPVWNSKIEKELFYENLESEKNSHWENINTNEQINRWSTCNSSRNPDGHRFNYSKTFLYKELQASNYVENIDFKPNTYWSSMKTDRLINRRFIDCSSNNRETRRFNPYRKVII